MPKKSMISKRYLSKRSGHTYSHAKVTPGSGTETDTQGPTPTNTHPRPQTCTRSEVALKTSSVHTRTVRGSADGPDVTGLLKRVARTQGGPAGTACSHRGRRQSRGCSVPACSLEFSSYSTCPEYGVGRSSTQHTGVAVTGRFRNADPISHSDAPEESSG